MSDEDDEEAIPPEVTAGLFRLDLVLSAFGHERFTRRDYAHRFYASGRFHRREAIDEWEQRAGELVAAGLLVAAPSRNGGQGWQVTDAGAAWVEAELQRRQDWKVHLEQQARQERLAAQIDAAARFLKRHGYRVTRPDGREL